MMDLQLPPNTSLTARRPEIRRWFDDEGAARAELLRKIHEEYPDFPNSNLEHYLKIASTRGIWSIDKILGIVKLLLLC